MWQNAFFPFFSIGYPTSFRKSQLCKQRGFSKEENQSRSLQSQLLFFLSPRVGEKNPKRSIGLGRKGGGSLHLPQIICLPTPIKFLPPWQIFFPEENVGLESNLICFVLPWFRCHLQNNSKLSNYRHSVGALRSWKASSSVSSFYSTTGMFDSGIINFLLLTLESWKFLTAT